MTAWPEGARRGPCEDCFLVKGVPERSTEGGRAAAGGCGRAQQSRGTPVVKTRRRRKSKKKLSCLVLWESGGPAGETQGSKTREESEGWLQTAVGTVLQRREFYSGNDEKPF